MSDPNIVIKGPDAVQDAVALTVSGGATPSDMSDPIDIRGMRTISLQIQNGDSTDLDIEVYTSMTEDGTYDNVVYASESTLGADKNKTITITPGPNFMKIKLVNQDASNATAVTTLVSGAW